jgi:hypothetical protein
MFSLCGFNSHVKCGRSKRLVSEARAGCGEFVRALAVQPPPGDSEFDVEAAGQPHPYYGKVPSGAVRPVGRPDVAIVEAIESPEHPARTSAAKQAWVRRRRAILILICLYLACFGSHGRCCTRLVEVKAGPRQAPGRPFGDIGRPYRYGPPPCGKWYPVRSGGLSRTFPEAGKARPATGPL